MPNKLDDDINRQINMTLNKNRGMIQYDKFITDRKVIQISEKEIALEVSTQNETDVFILTSVSLVDDILPFRSDLRLKYAYTRLINLTEEEKLTKIYNKDILEVIEDKNGNQYKLVELACVRYLLEDMEENIVNHTMGIPFCSNFSNGNFIYTKTVHEDSRCTEEEELINLFFGPTAVVVSVNLVTGDIKLL